MNPYQPIYDIAELCAAKGLTNAVLCPGSRCAPLALAFSRHEKITTRTFTDERSAGFVALGMAQQKQTATILLCTSGTAVYNFSPAVAEAYFSEVPLVIFTADRPAEWIAQHDGQTIYQAELFGKHVKKFFQLPQDYDHADSKWAINRIVNEAINLASQEPRGPVHINAPFREPLYPQKDEATTYTQSRIIEEHKASFTLSADQKEKIKNDWPKYNKILIVAGQHDHDEQLLEKLNNIVKEHKIPIAGDIISNTHEIEKSIRHADLFLGQASADIKKSLQPDLLITYGKSVLSKNLKLFLRKHLPAAHWHIQAGGMVADPFHSTTSVFKTTPLAFFHYINTLTREENFESQKQNNYENLWEIEERKALRTLGDFFPQPEFAELELVNEILKNLPVSCNLHLANSMSVRYANFIGLLSNQHDVKVYSNRGTSGIDGCSSTAVGHSLSNDRPNILLTGDLAFFYDRNAFWHNYPLQNLRIVVLNNHGGIIFKMIDGPSTLPESDEYFVTRQKLNAQKLCEEFDFNYLKLDSKRKLKNLLKDLFDFDGKTKILELESDTTLNKIIFDNFKQKIKESYEL
jgi:2-succinyl-5-enolpyruvyl-6-hydroxy-3-cyclohexene-1-carboxylate synthase